MSLTFINQPLKSAVVPMFVGSFGQKVPAGDGTWVLPRANEGDHARRSWWWVWALYSFRDADCGGAVSMVEGRMLLGQHIHDFCGGVLASSGGCVFQGLQSTYDWSTPRLGIHSASPLRISAHARANVPSLHDAIRLDRALTRDEAASIMNRSIMLWALARANEYGKRGIIGFDRYSERPKFRRTLRYAGEIGAIPNFTLAPIYDAEHACQNTRIVPSAPADTVEELLSTTVLNEGRYGTLRPIQTNVHEAPSYLNRNSGAQVGAVVVSYTTDSDNFDDDDEGEEIWDDELGEYVERRPPNAGEVTLPEYWRLAVRTPAYLAQQPTGMWSNG